MICEGFFQSRIACSLIEGNTQWRKDQLDIRVDDLQNETVISLLREHLATMATESPEESCHALDLDGLRAPEVTFWSVWDGSELAGFGAIKRLTLETGSMEYFAPARKLYEKHGFTPCEPFGEYKPDPYSVFMTLSLQR